MPSSDEEDSPCIYNAKFFPPKRNDEVYGRNRMMDETTASKNVPNTQQLVQNNTCYAFVQRAFKRFSIDNHSPDDQHVRQQFGIRENSAVPLESVNENELNTNLFRNSSFDLVSFQKVPK